MNLKTSHFNSFRQLLEQVVNGDREDSIPRTSLASIRHEPDRHFTATRTMEDALDIAHNGWPEGRKQIEIYTKEYTKLWQKFFPQQDFGSEMKQQETGSIIVMDEFLKGSPDCMLEFNPNEESDDKLKGSKLQRMIINACCNCHISTEAIYQRGALLAALVNSMELSGFNVEIIVVWQVDSGGWRSNVQQQLRYTLTLKKFQDFLDTDTLAFTLAHPAMLRRMIFTLIEQEPKNYVDNFVYSGYGHTTDIPDNDVATYGASYGGELKNGNMYFKYMDNNYGEKQLVEQCTAIVKEHFTEVDMNKKPSKNQ